MFFPNDFFDFINSKISYKTIIIISTNKLRANDLWYIKYTLVIKYFSNIFLAFLQLFYFDALCFKLIRLKLSKLYFYAFNISLIRVFTGLLCLKYILKLTYLGSNVDKNLI